MTDRAECAGCFRDSRCIDQPCPSPSEAVAEYDVYLAELSIPMIPQSDAEALARAVSASLVHGEVSPLAAALTEYLDKHPWSDL